MWESSNADPFKQYLRPPYRKPFLKVEQQARSDKKGIWALSDYERPRAFRKRLKVMGGN